MNSPIILGLETPVSQLVALLIGVSWGREPRVEPKFVVNASSSKGDRSIEIVNPNFMMAIVRCSDKNRRLSAFRKSMGLKP